MRNRTAICIGLAAFVSTAAVPLTGASADPVGETMPHITFTPDQMDDIVAYIMSLKPRH
jgi:hypothetical protein